jgi:hypothetical protein
MSISNLFKVNDYNLNAKNLNISDTLTTNHFNVSDMGISGTLTLKNQVDNNKISELYTDNTGTFHVSDTSNIINIDAKTTTQDLTITDTLTDAKLYMNLDGSLNISCSDVIPNALFIAKLNNEIIAEYPASYSLPVATSNVSITNNKLDMTNSHSYARWDGSIIDFGVTGTIKFKYTPNYDIGTGDTSLYNCFSFGDGANLPNNAMSFSHNADNGELMMLMYDSTGNIKGYLLGTWLSTKGQEYEIEYDFNDGNIHRFFIDGVIFNTHTYEVTRTKSSFFQLGLYLYSPPAFSFTNGYIRDVIIYNNIQHTASYTAGYTINGGVNLTDSGSYIKSDYIESQKDITAGENLYLKTTGYTPSPLNFYQEEVGYHTQLGGAIITFLNGKFQRLNNIVTIHVEETSDTKIIDAPIYNDDGNVPAQFRPTEDVYLPYSVINNGKTVLGTLNISSAGRMTFYNSGHSDFDSGTVGIRRGTVVYHI